MSNYLCVDGHIGVGQVDRHVDLLETNNILLKNASNLSQFEYVYKYKVMVSALYIYCFLYIYSCRD